MLNIFAHHTQHHEAISNPALGLTTSSTAILLMSVLALAIVAVFLHRYNLVQNIKTLVKGRNK